MKLDLKQLPLKENAIIVWRTEELVPDVESVCRALAEAGYTGGLIILRPGDDLAALSDEELGRMGLQRKEPKPALTGYWYATGTEQPATDAHGHYIESRKESVPVAHIHKGGRRAHFHEEGDTNGSHNSQ